MEIRYTKEKFNLIWGTKYKIKIEKDEELPQTPEFAKSYLLQEEFAKNYANKGTTKRNSQVIF